MSFSNRRKDHGLNLAETIDLFKELAQPFAAQGDLDEVSHIYNKAYAEAMKGRKSGSLEGMRTVQAMEQALQEVLTQQAKTRHHYFDAFRDDWWRN